MKKYIYFGITFLFFGMLTACSSSTNKLCDCVEAGMAVNQISASFFNRPATQEGKDSLDAAIANRDKICEEFNLTSDVELQEQAHECPSLKINTEE